MVLQGLIDRKIEPHIGYDANDARQPSLPKSYDALLQDSAWIKLGEAIVVTSSSSAIRLPEVVAASALESDRQLKCAVQGANCHQVQKQVGCTQSGVLSLSMLSRGLPL